MQEKLLPNGRFYNLHWDRRHGVVVVPKARVFVYPVAKDVAWMFLQFRIASILQSLVIEWLISMSRLKWHIIGAKAGPAEFLLADSISALHFCPKNNLRSNRNMRSHQTWVAWNSFLFICRAVSLCCSNSSGSDVRFVHTQQKWTIPGNWILSISYI